MSKNKEVIHLFPQHRKNHYSPTRPVDWDRVIFQFAVLLISYAGGSATLNYIQKQPNQNIASGSIISQSSECRFTNSKPVTYYTHPSQQPETAIGQVEKGTHSCQHLLKPTRPNGNRWISFVDSRNGNILGYVDESLVKVDNLG